MILPMCLMGAYYVPGPPLPWPIAIGIVLGLTIYLGHFNALLRCRRLGVSKDHPEAKIRYKVFGFVVLQLYIVPAFWIAVQWGARAIARAL